MPCVLWRCKMFRATSNQPWAASTVCIFAYAFIKWIEKKSAMLGATADTVQDGEEVVTSKAFRGD